jgi:methyltransferase (TIGR00027 family)
MRFSVVRRHRVACFVALLALAVVAQSIAVEPGLPSKTSILIASMRAVASHDPDPAVRNPDWLAERFIGPRERALIPDHYSVQALSLPYEEALRLGPVGAISRAALIRTRFMDDKLVEAVQHGAKQIVILGAGFDSRAYRLRNLLAGTKVFEIDYGPTQEYKKQRVREILGALPPNLVFTPIDFTKEKLANVLRKAGYRDNLRTFVIWEGVTFYIPEDAVVSTLQTLKSVSAPGSSIVLDFMTKTYVEGDPKNPRTTPAGFPQWGEPWIFGIPDGAEDQFFAAQGFNLVEKHSLSGTDQEIAKLYLTRKDGSVFPGANQNLGAYRAPTGEPGYWIAEIKARTP